ncbi:MAG: transglycosylase, partial [Hyphomicrobiaceae bacterium]
MIAATYDPIAYAELPGWADDDHAAALHAFQASCARVTAPRHSPAAGGEAIAPLLMPSCKAAAALPPKVAKGEARAFFER